MFMTLSLIQQSLIKCKLLFSQILQIQVKKKWPPTQIIQGENMMGGDLKLWDVFLISLWTSPKLYQTLPLLSVKAAPRKADPSAHTDASKGICRPAALPTLSCLGPWVTVSCTSLALDLLLCFASHCRHDVSCTSSLCPGCPLFNLTSPLSLLTPASETQTQHIMRRWLYS